MTATFSDDRALTVARGVLNQPVLLTFKADAFLHRIDELQRDHKRRSWELEDFLLGTPRPTRQSEYRVVK